MGKYIDITGHKFGRLTAISFAFRKERDYYWNVKCDCGKEFITKKNNVMGGYSKSCGCYMKEQSRENAKRLFTKHNLKKHSIYHTWEKMRRRCLNPNCKEYPRYGGRGIKVCNRWQKFENFLKDMGERPSNKHSIDRIDNDGNYCPENCRWATAAQQCRNRRSNIFYTFNGETKCLQDWANDIGITGNSLKKRIEKYDWSLEKALTTPAKSR